MTVADLIGVLRTLPADARVIVEGFESGFDDVTGAVIQPIVVNGGHRKRMLSNRVAYVPADCGGGDHEAPGKPDVVDDSVVEAVYITSSCSWEGLAK